MKDKLEKVKGFIGRHKRGIRKGATLVGMMFMGYAIGKKKTIGAVGSKLHDMCLINPDFRTSLKETENQLNDFNKTW